MQVSFLSAADNTPLTKTFTLENGELQKQSYPNTRDFTSHSYQINDLNQFFRAAQQHADAGHCLLKGKLHRELNTESRAGSTHPNDTTAWIFFDLDGVTGFDSIEDFIQRALPDTFHNVSYIVHKSSSAGLVERSGLYDHIIFMLNTEYSAPLLKLYLENLNFQTDELRTQLSLTASGTALKYTLDITTCQNDKLLFIAPPILGEGVTRNIDANLELVEKAHMFASPSLDGLNPAILQVERLAQINRLREANHLPAKTVTYKSAADGTRYITNPDQAIVTGQKSERGFTYLNLNGGDSWAYYFPEGNPTYLYSFKDPDIAYRMADILPDFIIPEPHHTQNHTEHTKQLLVFRDFRTDTYWNGIYDPASDTHEIAKTSSKEKIRDFYKTNGISAPKNIPDWDIVFDPTSNEVINFRQRWLNKFVPSDYMKQTHRPTKDVPPTIKRIIYHVLGNDDLSYDAFMNWCAVMFQKRTKTLTAWVITGTEGTGKGILFFNILAPLLGHQYCAQKGITSLEDNFNEWEETCLLLNFNEARLSDSKQTSRILNRLKLIITEPKGQIRAMRTNPYEANLYTNVIITSNNNDAIQISEGDRRFHVSPRQEEKLEIQPREIDGIKDELPLFASFLANYAADIKRASTVEMNQARIDMQKASQTSIDQMFEAISAGDLEYFTQHLTGHPSIQDNLAYSDYERVLRKWIGNANTPCKVTQTELLTVYNYLQADRPIRSNKFTRMLKHHNITLRRMRDDNELFYGILIEWKADEEVLEHALPPNVVHIANSA